MNRSILELTWPAAQLGEALEMAGLRAGLGAREAEVGAPPPRLLTGDSSALGGWIEAAASWLGLEAEPVETPYAEVERLIRTAGPALVRLPDQAEARFLVLLRGSRRSAVLLSPELEAVHVEPEAVRAAMCQSQEAPLAKSIEQSLAEAGVPTRRQPRARQAVLRELLGEQRVGDCWLLRPSGGAAFTVQAREAHLPRLLAVLLLAHGAAYALWLVSWWLLGGMALRGQLDRGWLLAWLLLLLTPIPFRLLSTSAGGLFAIQAGALLKRRLLFGAMRLDSDAVRHLGAGQLLGRVIESEVVEAAALEGGFVGLTAVIELALSGFVLGAGAGSWGLVLLLLGTVGVTVLLCVRYYRRRRWWTNERLEMTNDLVERMLGHRTRLAQEARARWNEGEDQALERYLRASEDLDRRTAALQMLVPRGWFIVGLLGLAPAFLAGNRSTAALAVGIGGVLLAYRAFGSLVQGLEKLAAAGIAWERVQLFWRAATRREPIGQPELVVAAPADPIPTAQPARNGASLSANRRVLVDARDLVFRYRDRGNAVLQSVAVQVRAGDRLLLEGSSGGGKSTLAALLAGARVPESGLVLLDGLDRETLGAERWRRRVVIAPQFHENHVLMGTFAFNALLGRGWPPHPGDLEEAEQVCRALGLGDLLDRMPAGMQQVIGETGWQLSQGEKSRLYLARALLQNADVVILDESFGALDPATLRQCLTFVLEAAPTLLVIAHP
jgi:ATP-binding cassette subfamily B protein